MIRNVMVCIHGITPDDKPIDMACRYRKFRKALIKWQREIEMVIPEDHLIGVQWGHPANDSPPSADRPDLKLMVAQKHLADAVSYTTVKRHPGPNNVVKGLLDPDLADPLIGVMRALNIFNRFRDEIILQGVGDVIYYVSDPGETQVRQVIYGTVLRQLEALGLGQEEVRLHVVGHSLGVTIAHDFLYGLFAPGITPDFIDGQGAPDDQDRYEALRARAQEGSLKLGSFSCFASQLPLFTMRVPRLIEGLYEGRPLDPSVIGVPTDSSDFVWQLFYDIDDPLAFCTRPLYSPNGSIREFQVDCGDHLDTHSNYWCDATVHRETAQLILDNCGH